MALLKFNWLGPAITAEIFDATRDAMDETMAACVRVAKPLAPFRFGVLRGSIKFEPAKRQGPVIVGRWGSFDVNYAIYQELGTRFHRAHPFLRPAADQEFPKFKGRIKARFGA